MKQCKWKTLGTLVLCVIASSTFAQKVYTLDELFTIAEQNSTEIGIQQTAVASAEQDIKQAKNAMLPSLSVDLSVGYLGNGWLAERDFTGGQSIENPHFMNNFSVKAEQVVYSGGALTAALHLSKYGAEMAQWEKKSKEQQVRFVVAGYYLDLMRLANQARVLEENIRLTDTLLNQVATRVEAGAALSNDYTRYELQLQNLQLSLRKVNDASIVTSFRLATLLHLDDEIAIDENAELKIDELRSLVDWQNIAKTENTQIGQANTGVKIKEENVKISRADMIPKIAIFAANNLNGPITIEVPVIDKNFNYWYAGIGVSYDLSALYKSHRSVKKAQLNVQQAQQERSLLEENILTAVQSAYMDLLTAQAEVETQQKSVQLASENYTLTSYRYQNGLALLTDMLDAANTKLSAETALVNANIAMNFNYYKLLYITSSL